MPCRRQSVSMLCTMPTRSAPISLQQTIPAFLLCASAHKRKAWLFADTSQAAKASTNCFSLIETAKANELQIQAYIHHVLPQSELRFYRPSQCILLRIWAVHEPKYVQLSYSK